MTHVNFAVAALVIFLAGCGSSRDAGKEEEGRSGAEDLQRFEADFRPSDYDPDPEKNSEAVTSPSGVPEVSEPGPVSYEHVQGYRVQIFAGASIDEANSQKSLAESLFPLEWFYLQYDPPTYKVRAGNFVTRFEAERFAKVVSEKGFPGAWAVPERVFKSPPNPPAREPQPAPR
jgi:hypothetical protein